MRDSIKWHPVVRVLKYHPDTVQDIIRTYKLEGEPTGPMLRYFEEHHGLVPDDVFVAEGNSLVTTGLQRLGDLFTGSGTAFTSSRGMTGVGDSSTATTAGMTSLQAGTNTYYKALDGSPSSSSGVISGTTTFQTSEANYAWNEWCWCIATTTPVSSSSFSTATTSGIMVNRKVQSLGTKTSGAIWALQATITIS